MRRIQRARLGVCRTRMTSGAIDTHQAPAGLARMVAVNVAGYALSRPSGCHSAVRRLAEAY